MRPAITFIFRTMTATALLLSLSGALYPLPAEAAPDRLVIYSGRKEKALKPVVDAFTKQTGIPVDLKVGKTAGLANEIRMEKARPRGDLYISTESGIVEILTKDGLLEPHQSAATKAVADDFKSAAGTWTGISGRARIILYNKNLVPEKDVPRSIFALTDPKWKGQLAIAGTRERTTLAWATALVASKGEAFTRDYLKGLHANGLKILADNTEVWQGVGRGEFAIGLTNSPNYYLSRQNNLPVGVIYPDQDASGWGTPVNPNVAAVIKGAPNPEAARKFIDFVLSPDGQRILVTQDYEIPLVDNADAGAVLPLKSIKRPAVSAERLAELEEATLKLLTSLDPNW
ncbi:MAG: extracellular solute-binding protein [Nitrospirae bacterium]|nr:MAG: extracellular solute-binding protein [Nitrospirota bacterium]